MNAACLPCLTGGGGRCVHAACLSGHAAWCGGGGGMRARCLLAWTRSMVPSGGEHVCTLPACLTAGCGWGGGASVHYCLLAFSHSMVRKCLSRSTPCSCPSCFGSSCWKRCSAMTAFLRTCSLGCRRRSTTTGYRALMRSGPISLVVTVSAVQTVNGKRGTRQGSGRSSVGRVGGQYQGFGGMMIHQIILFSGQAKPVEKLRVGEKQYCQLRAPGSRGDACRPA